MRRLTKKGPNSEVRYVSTFFKVFTMIYLLFCIIFHLTSPTIAYLNDTEKVNGTLSFSEVFDENTKENNDSDKDLDSNPVSETEVKELEEKDNVQQTDKSAKESSTDVQEDSITEENDIQNFEETKENMDAETVDPTEEIGESGESDLE